MSRGRVLLAVLPVLGLLVSPTTAQAGRPVVVSVGGFSSQASSGSALIGGELGTASAGSSTPAEAPGSGAAATPSPPPPPTLASDSPLLADPVPAGAGSFWYQGAPGERCIYAPSSSPACFEVISAAPRLDIAATATRLASELDLSLAPIEASPAADRDGLAGAPSWFWLDAPLTARGLSLSLAGETVTVSARPGAVAWTFGDGGSLEGDAGVPFAQGPAPPAAITHVFQTRCLPGDQGSDPYVLASCGPEGYEVTAEVTWTVAFDARGTLGASGSLPSRSTRSELTYPVSELRAFLGNGVG